MNKQENRTATDDYFDHLRPGEAPLDAWGLPDRKKGVSKTVWVLGGLIGLVMLACLGMVTVVIARTVIFGVDNNDEWLAVSDNFMQAMADKNRDEAQAFFSEDLNQELKGSGLAAFLDGPFFGLFEGYDKLEIESYYLNYGPPYGTTIELAGPVYYQENYTGYFEFVLTEEGDSWKFLAFNVTVPPEKINSSAGQSRPDSNRTKQIPARPG